MYVIANTIAIVLSAILIIFDEFSLLPYILVAFILGVGGIFVQGLSFFYTLIIMFFSSWRADKYLDFESITLLITNIITILILIANDISDKKFVIWLLLVNVSVMCSILSWDKNDN
jgi:hypothetical protein